MKCIVAYVPVLHEGYAAFFQKYKGSLYLVGPTFVSEEFPRLIRDLRQLPVGDMLHAIEGLGVCAEVKVLDAALAQKINEGKDEVVMPDEDISHTLAEKYFTDCTVTYDHVFLRWDKPVTLAEQEVSPDRTISTDEMDQEHMHLAVQEARKCSDWWRQIGSVAVRGTEVLFTEHARYLPSDYNLFAAGNPRDNFDAGEHPEIYTSIHSEASIVAQAARAGVSLEGADMYVTTFPCANCARLLAEAGVKKVYYRDGYSRLDAEDIFKAYDVEVILVQE